VEVNNALGTQAHAGAKIPTHDNHALSRKCTFPYSRTLNIVTQKPHVF